MQKYRKIGSKEHIEARDHRLSPWTANSTGPYFKLPKR